MAINPHWKTDTYLITEYSGDITFQEIRGFLMDLSDNPAWVKTEFAIADMRKVTSITITEKQLVKLSDHLSIYDTAKDNFRLAIIPGTYENSMVYGTFFIEEMSKHNIEVQLSLSIEEAENWLFKTD